MKNCLIVSAVLLLISGNALAGSSYDECIKKEKAMKAQEADDCSGLKYLFNPSGCFATRKALKEYAAGKCRQVGVTENVDFNAPKIISEKKVPSPVNTISSVPVISGADVSEKKEISEKPLQEFTLEQLKEENVRLKAEISRLKKENDQLRKGGR
jgi:hypothetical protein